METNNSSESSVLKIKTDKGLKIISKQKIFFIQANKKNSIVRIDEPELINSLHSLRWFSQMLLPLDFFRCHYSYLVNCRLVDCFSSKGITLKGNIIVPLSRNKLPELEKILAELQKEKEL